MPFYAGIDSVPLTWSVRAPMDAFASFRAVADSLDADGSVSGEPRYRHFIPLVRDTWQAFESQGDALSVAAEATASLQEQARLEQMSTDVNLSNTLSVNGSVSIPGVADVGGEDSVTAGVARGTMSNETNTTRTEQRQDRGYSVGGETSTSESYGSTTTDSSGTSMSGSYALSSTNSSSRSMEDTTARSQSSASRNALPRPMNVSPRGAVIAASRHSATG